jgi:hypothetical protein
MHAAYCVRGMIAEINGILSFMRCWTIAAPGPSHQALAVLNEYVLISPTACWVYKVLALRHRTQHIRATTARTKKVVSKPELEVGVKPEESPPSAWHAWTKRT